MIRYFTTHTDGETAIQRQSDRATQQHSERNGDEPSVVIDGIGGRWRSVVRGQMGRAYIGRPVLEKANLLTA